mmetsp:Transcript_41948/g.125478  ORF Transcript_41948/g.125478 Transcript_41948/m.125478 type:complete len:279 (+) Transcript_41948:736-1572(+)
MPVTGFRPKVDLGTFSAPAAMATSTLSAANSMMVSVTTIMATLNRKDFRTRSVCLRPAGQLVVPSPYWPMGFALPAGMSVPLARIRSRALPELKRRFRSVLRLTVALAATSCQWYFLPSLKVSSDIRCRTFRHGSTRPPSRRFFLWKRFHLATKRSASSTTTMSSPASASPHTCLVRGSSSSSLTCLGVATTTMPLTDVLSMSLRSMQTVSALPSPTSARVSPQSWTCRSAVGTRIRRRSPDRGALHASSSSRSSKGRRNARLLPVPVGAWSTTDLPS